MALDGDGRLAYRVLEADSPFVHTTVTASGGQLDRGLSAILAIIRAGCTLVPGPETLLEAGDKVIFVTRAGEQPAPHHLEVG